MQNGQKPRRESIVCVLKDRGKLARETRAADRHDDSVLEQEGAHLIDRGRAFNNGPATQAVERLQLELLHGFQRDAPHRGATGGFGNGAGVVEVVLIRF
jgi:hypothetical protein